MANPHSRSATEAARAGADPAGMQARRILALSSDLMLAVRVEEAAASAGFSAQTATNLAALPSALAPASVQLVLVDLADPKFPLEETLAALRANTPRPRVLAFYPHVRTDLAERARAAGCDLLLPRSRLLLDLPAALRSGAADEQASGEAQ